MSTLKITGMTCDSCAVHVKDALEKVPGVQSADVSYAKGSAKLAIEVGTSPDALTAAVAGLGYRATLADAPSVSTPGGLLDKRHCCKVSDEAAFCLIQRPYISKTLLTRRISPRGSP